MNDLFSKEKIKLYITIILIVFVYNKFLSKWLTFLA